MFHATAPRNSQINTGSNQYLAELCSEIEKFPNKFGELKDGPVFSIPILGVSSIVDDVFLNNLESLDESSSFHISNCVLLDSQIYVIKQELEELKDYLSIKNFTDGIDKWVDDETCLIGAQGTASGTLQTKRSYFPMQYSKLLKRLSM